MAGNPLWHCHFQKGNGEGGAVRFNVQEEKGEAATQLSSSHGVAMQGDCLSRQRRHEARRWRQLEVEENGTQAVLSQLRLKGLEARWVVQIKKCTTGRPQRLVWAKMIWAGQREREIVFRISVAGF
jgi:hypothetical protein